MNFSIQLVDRRLTPSSSPDHSALYRRRLEDPRRVARRLSLQVAKYRIYEQDLPSYVSLPALYSPRRADLVNYFSLGDTFFVPSSFPSDSQHRRALGISLPGRHQPNLVPHVRHDQHLRSVPSSAAPLPERGRPTQRRGGGLADEGC